MAALQDQTNPDSQPDLYLDPDQQDLLLAALTSNKPNPTISTTSTTSQAQLHHVQRPTQASRHSSGSIEQSTMFQSPLQQTPRGSSIGNGANLESPFLYSDLEYDVDGSFDFDDSNLTDGQLIGALPKQGSSTEGGEGDGHDKRKMPGDDSLNGEAGAKRREGDEKQAKKPGRKPLTSEPTSKRKAQNRAAQRAFRDRKEKHLKDLEVKVNDLEKASESANHENGLLRAQVDRLSTELREYRKRMSLNAGGTPTRSPPLGPGPAAAQLARSSGPFGGANDFSFDFPIFGLPGEQALNNVHPRKSASSKTNTYSIPGVVRVDSQSLSPTGHLPTPRQGSYSNTAFGGQSGGVEGLDGLFSPSILETASKGAALEFAFNGDMNTNKPVRQNSATSNASFSLQNSSSTTSPSASSVSHKGAGSSTGTSPESSGYSPVHGNGKIESSLHTISEENNASRTSHDNSTGLQSTNASGDLPDLSKTTSTATSEFNGIDWLAQQNGGQFDPVLFGDYREPQENILAGDYDTFFNEAFPLPDLASPFNGDLSAMLGAKPQYQENTAHKPRAEEKEKNLPLPNDDEVVFSHNQAWDKLQTNAKFQSGDIDLDSLCSDMRRKARCSETGAIITKKDFDASLAKCEQASSGGQKGH